MTHTDFESGAVPRTGAVTNPTTPAARQAQGTHESLHQPSDCAPTIVVDFAQEPEFPEKPNGDAPKVENVRAQVAAYVDGYGLAKSTLPPSHRGERCGPEALRPPDPEPHAATAPR